MLLSVPGTVLSGENEGGSRPQTPRSAGGFPQKQILRWSYRQPLHHRWSVARVELPRLSQFRILWEGDRQCRQKDTMEMSCRDTAEFLRRPFLLNPCHTRAAFQLWSGSSPDRYVERKHRRGIAMASPQNAVESPRTPRDGVCVLLQIIRCGIAVLCKTQ
jgi:hypothetical protein